MLLNGIEVWPSRSKPSNHRGAGEDAAHEPEHAPHWATHTLTTHTSPCNPSPPTPHRSDLLGSSEALQPLACCDRCPQTFSLHALRSELLGSQVLAVYLSSERPVGLGAYSFEQRDWLEALGVKDKVDYRKREHTAGYVNRCISKWGLAGCDFFKGGGQGVPTSRLSTSLLAAWLFTKLRHYEQGRDLPRGRKVAGCLESFFAVAAEGAHLCDEPPACSACGVNLPLASDCTFDLQLLSPLFPTLMEEWHQLSTSATTARLGPVPTGNRVLLGDMLVFAEARVNYSSLPDGHWVVLLRNGLLQIAAYCVEVRIHAILLAEEVPLSRLSVTPHYGKTGKRKARHGALTKLQWVEKVINQPGQSETILRTLSNVHGCAAVVRNVSNTLYSKATARAFEQSRSVSLSWDGAGYGGLPINVAYMVDCQTAFAAHLCPRVRSSHTLEKCETMALQALAPLSEAS